MPPRATRRRSVHPSSSSLCAGSGTRRAALSDASNVVVADVTSSRPNHHHRQKRIATTNGRKKNAHRDLDDDVQQKGRRIITKERKEGVFLLDALLDELDGDFAKRIEEIRERVLEAEKKVAKQFAQHSKKLSKIARRKRAADVKGYEESAFVAARKEVAELIFRREEEEEEEEGADGEEMRGKKKRKTSSSREDGSGGEEEEEERAGDASAPAPPLVDAVAETAATSVEETTVIETMVGEENKEKSEVEEVDEFYEPALVLKTDSGTEVDLTKLRSSKDVAPEMGGYLKKLQQQLSILLGGGNRTSD